MRGGLPHSEIPGSTIARISPGLFAACHVLHRLSVPRHPPDALTSRLSATPNGKDHPISRCTRTSGRSAAHQNHFGCGKLLLPQKTLLSRDLHSHRRRHYRTHAQPRAARRSPATVTQLASLRLSISNMPRPPHTGMRRRHISGSSCRVRSGCTCRRLSGCCANPCRRSAVQLSDLRPVVEVIGIEPTTPCLQSRCSPS